MTGAVIAHIRRWEDYKPLKGVEAAWAPHLETIAGAHGLKGAAEVFRDGTHPAGAIRDAVVKLYLPFWRDGEVETWCLEALNGGEVTLGGVRSPRLLAQGRYQGWRYAVMERLPGVLLSDAWEAMTPGEHATAMGRVGEALGRLHQAPPPSAAGALDQDWAGFVARQRARAVERQRAWGLSARQCEAIPGFLAQALRPLHLGGLRLGWLHGDMTSRQVLVLPSQGFALSGLIDFGDARAGHAEYDIAGAAAFMARGDAGALRALLLGYGYPSAALTQGLAARLMGWLLLHDHGDVAWLARTHLKVKRLPPDWAGVRDVFFPL
jgi:hygromycin-B 7''-O-kinase